MRILNVCETARGGVGIYQNDIAGLRRPGLEMHHLVPEQDADFLDPNLDLHVFDRPRRGAGAVRAMLAAFRRVLRDLDPDICFFHSSFSLAALALMRAGGDRRPALYCPHGWAVLGYGDHALKARAVRGVEGRLSALADRVICVSEHERALARNLGYRGRFTVVENGVPDAPPDVAGDLFAAEFDRLHLLFVGRQDRQKGFDLLASALTGAARPDLRLHVIGGAVRGGGPAVAVPEGVDMVGWVARDDVDRWYRSADALIVPSRWEGLPLVIPEALRNGTPVLCSDRSGMDGLIEDGRTGAVFPLEGPALTGLLTRLDKGRLRAMRPACRAAYEARFTVGRMRSQIEAVFDEVLASSRGGAAAVQKDELPAGEAE